jgi:BirA family transcriptional regulator, biotin operon repressor / biotin---[acetyl-CoA-carboxylase] ligase
MTGRSPQAPAPLLLRLDPFPTHDTCGSTQDLCRSLALAGAPEGTAVTALEQTAGRGRMERIWSSPAGQGLWISFLLRPSVDSAEWPTLTALTALALAEAVESLPGALAARSETAPWQAAIKWPNDLLGRRGKLAGILAEVVGATIVVGVGLNLAQTEADFPGALHGRGASLRLEGFDPVPSPQEAARRFNQSLTGRYADFQNGRWEPLRRGLLERFHLRDAWVEIDSAGARISGRAVDLGPRGELILRTEQGTRSVVSGEIISYR